MRTARRGLRRRPRLPPDPAILITASCGVPPGAGPRTMCVRTSGAESERLGVLRWGRFTRPGTLPSRRRHPARAGTGILSPTASNAPGRAEMSLALQDVPGCEAVSPPGAARTRSYVPDGVERPCGLCRPGSRTYLSIEDCVLLQKVTARAQSFGGEVRPGRRTQSSIRPASSPPRAPAPPGRQRPSEAPDGVLQGPLLRGGLALPADAGGVGLLARPLED